MYRFSTSKFKTFYANITNFLLTHQKLSITKKFYSIIRKSPLMYPNLSNNLFGSMYSSLEIGIGIECT